MGVEERRGLRRRTEDPRPAAEFEEQVRALTEERQELIEALIAARLRADLAAELIAAVDPESVARTLRTYLVPALARSVDLEPPARPVSLTPSVVDDGAALTFTGAEGDRLRIVLPESGGDRGLVVDLGWTAMRAAATARAVSAQRHTAAVLERSLLPASLARLPGLELAARYRAAGPADRAGGDFYDAVAVEGRLLLIVGDVQGKGVEAATLTSMARHTLRAGAFRGARPSELMLELNRALVHDATERRAVGDPDVRFLTAAVAEITPRGASADVVIARGGHPPPVVVRSRGTVDVIEPAGPLLGFFAEATFAEEHTVLDVADTLLLYTDGVTEHRPPAPRFDEGVLGQLVRSRRDVADAGAIADLVISTVERLQRDAPPDDLALVVCSVTPPPRSD